MKKACTILWKTIKIVLIVVAVLIVAILAGVLGPIVKWTAPTIAKCMGAEVSLEECTILPLGGYVKIGGLRVENPTAFRTQNAAVYDEMPLAQVGNLEVDFAMRSLFGKEYVVDKVELTGVRALYAFDYNTTNVDALVDQMGLKKAKPASNDVAQKAEPTAKAEATPKAPKTEKPKKELPNVRLAYVNIADNSVTLRKFMNFPVVIPPMTIENTSTEDLKTRLMKMLEPALKALKGVGDTLGKGVNTATETLGTGLNVATETLGTGLNNVTDALGTGLNATTDTLADSLTVTKDALGESLKATKESLGDNLKTTKDSLGESLDSAKESLKDLKGIFKNKKK